MAHGKSIEGVAASLRVTHPCYSQYFKPFSQDNPRNASDGSVRLNIPQIGQMGRVQSMPLRHDNHSIPYNPFHEPEKYQQAKMLVVPGRSANLPQKPPGPLPKLPRKLDPRAPSVSIPNSYNGGIHGLQVPIRGSQVPIRGSQMPIHGSQMPIHGSQVPTNSFQVPTHAPAQKAHPTAQVDAYQAKPPSEDVLFDESDKRSVSSGAKSAVSVRLPSAGRQDKTATDAKDATNKDGLAAPKSAAVKPVPPPTGDEKDGGTVIRRKARQNRGRLPTEWSAKLSADVAESANNADGMAASSKWPVKVKAESENETVTAALNKTIADTRISSATSSTIFHSSAIGAKDEGDAKPTKGKYRRHRGKADTSTSLEGRVYSNDNILAKGHEHHKSQPVVASQA